MGTCCTGRLEQNVAALIASMHIGYAYGSQEAGWRGLEQARTSRWREETKMQSEAPGGTEVTEQKAFSSALSVDARHH
jgi:hypothetical protein